MKKTQPVGIGMTPSKTELGNYIRARRIELHLSQIQLAELSEIPQGVISYVEIGNRKFLDEEQVNGLAKALKCDVTEFGKRMPIKYKAEPMTELGKFIRDRRKELNLTIEAFAKRMKIDPKQARLFELRSSPSIRYHVLKPLATTLELDPSVISRFVGSTRNETTSKLGQIIRSRRKELGLSIIDLADKLGVSRQFVDQIEFGQCRLSTADKWIVKLSDVLGLNVTELEAVRPTRKFRKKSNSNNSDSLGGFLASKRSEQYFTQRVVAEKLGVKTQTVSLIETGRLIPSVKLLENFSQILNCKIPANLIPVPPVRQISNVKRETGLGKFLFEKRQEFNLSEAQLALKAGISISVMSGIEMGTYRPGPKTVGKLSMALGCQIPVELIAQIYRVSKRIVVHLSKHNLADIRKIKELSNVLGSAQVVGKSLEILRMLLEKQKDGHTVSLRKEGAIVDLEHIF